MVMVKRFGEHPDDRYSYFVYDEIDGGDFRFFASEEDCRQCIEDIVSRSKEIYEDSCIVTSIYMGKINVTHRVVKTSEIKRPENLEFEGVDEFGIFWPEGVEEICDYELMEVWAV